VVKLDIKIYLVAPLAKNGPVAQLNSALDFGSSGYKFESCQGHEERKAQHTVLGFFVLNALKVYFPKSI
jgi:hypothetical protein